MPIKPENKDRYPANWSTDIRPSILCRANNECECVGECGAAEHRPGSLVCTAPNRTTVYRNPDCPEDWRYDHELDESQLALWSPVHIILTVAHLDHTPENNEWDNLRAMCQRCHLRYDRDHHAETRRKSRSQGTASQLPLL